ncbi:MAG: sulfite exporter TauE/SafE family protein [Euzebyales bacterium]|nr:sulfite exporter TauE/SafE family protein [Euzebyales bacterium]MBA3622068.1 sulfite exporter TauE/SafE family protein [Euzebyales bacterium]
MQSLVILLLVGFVAQLVDGALGMAYGVTSTTLLLTTGSAAAAASATVHLAEVGTTLASGVSHWRFGNVDWRVVSRIAIPGGVGAFLGAVVLSNLSTEAAKPWMAAILVLLGAYILIRFTLSRATRRKVAPVRASLLAPLGLVAGFVDATGGGGWGPVATPTLLVTGRMEPRKVIGSVDTSEFLVALAASVGFLLSLGSQGVSFPQAGVLLAGGLVAAPIAAWLVQKVAPRILGAAVGGLIVVTNTRTILGDIGVSGTPAAALYASLWAVWLGAVLVAVTRHRRESGVLLVRTEEPQPGRGPTVGVSS